MTELTSQHGRRGRPGRAPAARAWRPAVQLLGAALLAAGLALGAWLQNPRPAGALDLGILKALIPLRTAGLEAFYKLVEFWDGPQATPWIIAVVSLLIALRGHRAAGLVFGVMTGLSWLPGHVAKDLFPRDRPPAVTQPVWEVTGANSFPSGHTGLVVAAAVAAFLVMTCLGHRKGRWWLLGGLLAWAVVVGWSRMATSVHFPSDVLGGALLDGGMALLLYPLAGWVVERLSLTWVFRDTRTGRG